VPPGSSLITVAPTSDARPRWQERWGEKALVHQIHPVKLGIDISSALVSNLLLGRGYLRAGLCVRIAGPLLGSALVLATADLDRWADTRRGTYVRYHMPPSAQALRLMGDAVMGVGAARRSRRMMTLGAVGVALGWSDGLRRRAHPEG
jgi:hypothetical protein